MREAEERLRGAALKEFAKQLCGRLLDEGFIIHRYDAYSTESIYLKLDFGVCNSIRISGHKGKGYLKYRYNIGTDITKMCVRKDTYPRYYYPISECEAMVRQILQDREAKQQQYGKDRYCYFMRKNKAEHEDDRGFWSKSYRVLG